MMFFFPLGCDPTTPTVPDASTETSPPAPTSETDPPPPPVPRPAAHRNGDVDGDGYDDLVVSEPYRDDGIGAAYVYRGGPGKQLDAAPDLILDGLEAEALWGIPVDLPGDLDGDGIGDLLVGAPYGEEALVAVWLGAPGLALDDPQLLTDNGSDGLFGVVARGVGDASGDGLPDLLIGAPTGFYAIPGRAYLVLGGPDFDGDDRIELVPMAPSPAFGQAGAGVGDVDGDGVADLLLARPDLADATTDHADLFLGDGDGAADQALSGAKGFGAEVAGVGDFDGDGRSDAVISAPNTFTDGLARLWLHAGTSTGLDPVPVLTHSEAGDTLLGASLASAGDVDGDGAPDLAAGAPFGGVDRLGLAYVMLGGPGADLVPDVILEGGGPGVGWAIGAIDANGDGLGDLVVNRQDFASPDLDRVRVYYGGLAFDGLADTVLVGGGPTGEFGHGLPHGLLR